MTETTILDDSAVSEIESRANAATEGPWADLRDYTPPAVWSRGPTCRFQIPHNNADRDFIAHAREDVPALCRTVKALQSRLAQVEQERNELRQEVEGLRYQRMFTDSHVGDD